jgi:hypothetical protein
MPLIKGQFATASVYGLKERKAIIEGLGAMLVDADFDETICTTFQKN